MRHVDIINRFISDRGYGSYLSIGVDSLSDLEKIACKRKTAISDRHYGDCIVHMSADAYFSGPGSSESFDVVFVDGLHLCEQVTRDIDNALKHLNSGGVVVVHDCLPSNEGHASRQMTSGIWNGDVWKAVAAYFASSQFVCYTVDADFGCAVIDTGDFEVSGSRSPVKDGSSPSLSSMLSLSWGDFEKHGRRWLNVVSPDEFDKMYSTTPQAVKEPDKPTKTDTPKVQSFVMRTPVQQITGLQDMILHVGRDNMVVVEVGSFAGESAGIFLDSGKVSKIYCVDPWKPGYNDDDWASKEEILSNAEMAFDERFKGDPRVVKVKSTLQEAIAEGAVPKHVDLVYIDADTRFSSVIREMESACNMCDVLSGHDYCFDSVKKAIKAVYGNPERTFADNSWVVRNPARSVCVTIPMYSNTLSEDEDVSLHRCVKVLGPKHDIAIICPDSFDERVLPEDIRGKVRLERFDDKYFFSITAYSNLVGGVEFYDRFSAYTHVLLYQLDGYVFRDDLFEKWIRFDYVGAPWCLFCTECSISGISELVGNGGVCLRNVKKCRDVVKSVAKVVHPEDMRVFTARFNPAASSLVKPHCHEALEFSLETNPRRAYESTGKIPSFCHKLRKYDSDLFEFFKSEVAKAEAVAELRK